MHESPGPAEQMPRFAVPAILLDITALVFIVSSAGQLRVLSTIDYGEALVTIQSMLTELGVRRAREVRWQWLLMLSYSLLWSCGRRDASTTVRMELRKRWPTTSRDPLRASLRVRQSSPHRRTVPGR